MVVPFLGSYLGSCKVTPKRNYYGAYGYSPRALRTRFSLVSAGREACALGVNLASAEPDAPHNS